MVLGVQSFGVDVHMLNEIREKKKEIRFKEI